MATKTPVTPKKAVSKKAAAPKAAIVSKKGNLAVAPAKPEKVAKPAIEMGTLTVRNVDTVGREVSAIQESLTAQIAAQLTAARKKTKASLTGLSVASHGVHFQMISQYERGVNRPDIVKTLPWLLAAMGLEIEIKLVPLKPKAKK